MRISYTRTFYFLALIIFGMCLQQKSFAQTASLGAVDVSKMDLERNGGSAAVPALFCVSGDGFLWYTTSQGIVKDYGSERFVHNFVEKPDDFAVYAYNDIYEDSRQRVWVSTTGGIYNFSERTGKGKWYQWKNPETLEVASIVAIAETANGDLIFTTSKNYVLRYLTAEDRIVSYRVPDVYYESIPSDRNPSLYFINIEETLENQGVVLSQFHKFYLYKENQVTLLKDYSPLRNKGDTPYRFRLVENGLLFREGSSGTYLFEDKEYRYDYIPEIDRQIIQLPSNTFKIVESTLLSVEGYRAVIVGITAGRGRALHFYGIDKESRDMRPILEPFTFDRRIVDIAWSTKMPLYVSTVGEGFRLNYTPSPFKVYLSQNLSSSGEEQISVRGFVEDPMGKIYAGTSAGLYSLDTLGQTSAVYINNNASYTRRYTSFGAIQIQGDSLLWNAGEQGSLDKINLQSGSVIEYPLGRVYGSKSALCQTMTTFSNGNLLIGTTRGLLVFDIEEKVLMDYNPLSDTVDLSETVVKSLLVTPAVLWIGTIGSGVYAKDMKTGVVTHFTKENTNGELPSDNIHVIHETWDGSYYFGTQEGLGIYDPVSARFTKIIKNDGIADNVIAGITEDEVGIWISTFKGLTCYHKEDDWFYNFYVKDGLPDNEFNQESYYHGSDGTMYFGGLDGFISFKTNDVSFKKPNATIKIVKAEYYSAASEDIVVDIIGVSDRLQTLELPYERPFFNLSYAISDPIRPKDATYEYKISGINENWISLGNATNLRVNALPPGTYLLRLRGDDSSGNPTVNEIEMTIKVNQVFYKSGWFIAFNILGLLLLLVGFYEFRKYRWSEKLKQQRKVDQLEAKALRAQMNPHFMFNALNGLQSTMILKGEKEANKYLGSFSKLLRSSLDMSRTDTITLAEEISYLKSYLNLERMRQARPLSFQIRLEPETMDTGSIVIPCMLFQPIVENAILHGISPKRNGDAFVDIAFKEEGPFLIGTITDNGIGREAAALLKSKNKKPHTSWATKILAERIEIINRYTDKSVDLKVVDLYEGSVPKGTKVILKLPLN